MNEMKLNEEQRAAVESPAKNRLAIAAPGAGKTRTLCAAVAHEIALGTPPSTIVVVTYTAAAAGEMERRLKGEFCVTGRLGYCGTLHAFCLSLIREHPNALGMPDRLSVIDDDQREDVLETVRAEMGIKCSAKKALELLEASKGADMPGTSKEALLVKEYHRRLRHAGLIDFDMVLKLGLDYIRAASTVHPMHRYLVESREIQDILLKTHQWPFKAVFWDEGQDSADMDFDILSAMPCERKYLTGDSDQGIFQFRGGNVARFTRMAAPGSGWELHVLSTNYRSVATIVEHAQRLIEHNAGRVAKTMKAVRDGGAVEVHRCETPGGELGYVLDKIVRLICDNDPDKEKSSDVLKSVAVLARTNRLADSVAQHLAANGVPVRKSKERAVPMDWKRTKLLLTVLDNPHNDFAVYQYLVMKLGKTEADKLKQVAALNMTNLATAYKPIAKLIVV